MACKLRLALANLRSSKNASQADPGHLNLTQLALA